VVLPLALLIAIAAVVAFIWAVRGGQFDDLGTPGLRVLHDDEPGPAGPPSTAVKRADPDR
jgi:cbb3-type cytochrome oxidase maturation protein